MKSLNVIGLDSTYAEISVLVTITLVTADRIPCQVTKLLIIIVAIKILAAKLQMEMYNVKTDCFKTGGNDVMVLVDKILDMEA